MTSAYREMVLILDASQSMKEVDPQYDALEFVKGLAASLPSHYQIGMVVYQEEILKMVPLGSNHSSIEDGITDLTYRQYGDAGAALKEAWQKNEWKNSVSDFLFSSSGIQQAEGRQEYYCG